MLSSSKFERLFATTLLWLIIVFGIFIRVQNRDVLGDAYLFGTEDVAARSEIEKRLEPTPVTLYTWQVAT